MSSFPVAWHRVPAMHRCRYLGRGTQQLHGDDKNPILANQTKGRGSFASACLVVYRRSPKCLTGVKLEPGLGAAGRALPWDLCRIDTKLVTISADRHVWRSRVGTLVGIGLLPSCRTVSHRPSAPQTSFSDVFPFPATCIKPKMFRSPNRLAV
jgi:hypothetical protein